MAENIQPTHEDVTYVKGDKISCDGPDGDRHPRVYLTLKDGTADEVVCPYCGMIFRKNLQKSA